MTSNPSELASTIAEFETQWQNYSFEAYRLGRASTAAQQQISPWGIGASSIAIDYLKQRNIAKAKNDLTNIAESFGHNLNDSDVTNLISDLEKSFQLGMDGEVFEYTAGSSSIYDSIPDIQDAIDYAYNLGLIEIPNVDEFRNLIRESSLDGNEIYQRMRETWLQEGLLNYENIDDVLNSWVLSPTIFEEFLFSDISFADIAFPLSGQPIIITDSTQESWKYLAWDEDGSLTFTDFSDYSSVLSVTQGSFWQQMIFKDGVATITQYDENAQPIYVSSFLDNATASMTVMHSDGGEHQIDWNNLEVVEGGVSVVDYLETNSNGEVITRGSATYDSATGLTTVHQGPTDAVGTPIGAWETKIVAVSQNTGNTVVKSVPTDTAGAPTGEWQTSLELSEAYRASLASAALRDTDGAIVGNEIGTLFGSQLGQALVGDNLFAQLGAGTVLGTLTGNLGQALAIAAGEGLAFDAALEAAFDDFSTDLLGNVAGAGFGAVSALLTAELSDALSLSEEFGGDLPEVAIAADAMRQAASVCHHGSCDRDYHKKNKMFF